MYLVLARKYRPRTFAEVVGQEVVTGLLQGAIEAGRIGHAYLFSGPRGTGKTTTARILAKALNCERGPATEPCNECERCLAAERGAEADVQEIDAASHTGVDHIRDLRDQASYVPLRARYKVFLIDEVHMLSKGAFNALLKTLEEPPPHVKFLFATTELHQVPDTILSRCQVVKLNLISEAVIGQALDRILTSEEVQAEAGVTAELARGARGSMRDALSLTDQLLALTGREPSLAEAQRVLGSRGGEHINKLLDALEAGDPAAVLQNLPSAQGSESEVLSGLLEQLRSAVVMAYCPDRAELLEPQPDRRQKAVERAKRLGGARLERWLEELLFARERMLRLPAHAGLVLETSLLELCRPERQMNLATIEQRLMQLEQRLAAGGAQPSLSQVSAQAVAPQSAQAPTPKRSAPVAQAAPPAAAPRAQTLTPAGPGAPVAPGANQAAPAQQAAPQSTAPVEEAGAPGQAAPTSRSKPATAGAARSRHAAWQALLQKLAEGQPSLAELLERRGNLVDYRPGVARIQLKKLTKNDHMLAFDKSNQRILERIFTDISGSEVKVAMEDISERSDGKSDTFTNQVADLFGGSIEN